MSSFFDRVFSRTLSVLVTAAACVSAVHGEPPAASSEPPEALVKEALHHEIYGRLDDRARLLAAAVAKDPDFALARWQQGLIRQDGKWIDVESAAPALDSVRMTKYVERREDAPDTVEGQLQLATWCRNQQLPVQEKAHLARVLDLDPDNATARERLSYRMVSGRWVTTRDIAASTARLAKEGAAANRWRTELYAIRDELQSADEQRQMQATDRLRKIGETAAIPAMESILSLSCVEGALAVIDAVSEMRGQASVDSLIRHAVFSNWPRARTAAAEKLMMRRRESYVPLMLAEMYTPLVSEFGVGQLPNGRVGYRHAFLREGHEERQILYLDTEYLRIRRSGGNGQETLMRAFMDSTLGISRRQALANEQNQLQMLYNERVAEALNIATYQDLPSDPHAWWKWWDEQNDVVQIGDKQTRSRYQLQRVSMSDRPVFSSSQTNAGQRSECFAAGTKVWTSGGTRSIESIRVGDLVLAMDVESGELAYKPVTRTTVRPAGKLVRVTIGRDTFETSNGHLYWVSGHGWAKAKALESGMLLHCLRGAQPLGQVEPGTEAETYNLVVADFHTYFVGQERVLSHDVTGRRPTEAVVPGFSGE